MADLERILPGNAGGNFFVDDTCIDCDLCRQIAPEVFVEAEGQSIVDRQPDDKSGVYRAALALVACPTGSIGTREKTPEIQEAARGYPEPIAGGVYNCGYASRDSFGAKSYLIVRPGGNVLVDSPRFARTLAGGIEELGGVRTMFLTHRDDVADHRKFHAHFGCERIMHADDARGLGVEHALEGPDAVELEPDLIAIPTPGHTRGHVVLLYANRFLFTGDHLAWSPARGHLIAFRTHNWYSWPETIRSMVRLQDYRFEWVLPGHGRQAHHPPEVMARSLAECVEWMKRVA